MLRWPSAWRQGTVAPGSPAALTRRTYLEAADVRSHLVRVAAETEIRSVCDLGCGFGRLSAVLEEFTDRVTGFEREPRLTRVAQELNPKLDIRRVEKLERLPVAENTFDVVLSFTVLQHLSDRVAAAVAHEIRRVVRPGGFAILCEETDPSRTSARGRSRGSRRALGRPVEVYSSLLGDPALVASSPRRVEPSYRRRDTGTYMLFRLT